MRSRYSKAEGILLKSVKFGEGHKIITSFTKELGKVEVTAFGSRKPKSKLANKTQLFNHVRLLLYRSKENEPYTIKEVEVLKYFDNIKREYLRYIAASFIVEPIIKLLGKEQQDIRIFDLLLKTFYTLDTIDAKKIIYLLFMYAIKLLSSLGYRFNLSICSVCNRKIGKEIYIDSYRGFPLCNNCKTENSLGLNDGAIRFINWAQSEVINKSEKIVMSKNTYENLKLVLFKMYEFTFNISLDTWKYIDALKTEVG